MRKNNHKGNRKVKSRNVPFRNWQKEENRSEKAGEGYDKLCALLSRVGLDIRVSQEEDDV